MLNDNTKKWVAALRSGKYTQCRRRLHIKGDGYCCLGVACEVYMNEGHALDVKYREELGRVAAEYDGISSVLPEAVQQWLGLATYNGQFGHPSNRSCLSGRNDKGATFTEIADIIEAEPEGLFSKEEIECVS